MLTFYFDLCTFKYCFKLGVTVFNLVLNSFFLKNIFTKKVIRMKKNKIIIKKILL